MKRTALAMLILCVLVGMSFGANPVVVLQTSLGDIGIELYENEAPVTVDNFLHYVTTQFYDETIFHRLTKTDSSGIGVVQGGISYVIGFSLLQKTPDRGPIINESDNGLSNLRGTIAMARTSDPNSATSQFYINHDDNTYLDKANNPDGFGYCVFGNVIHGIEVVDLMGDWNTVNAGGIYATLPVPILTIYRSFVLPEGYWYRDYPANGIFWYGADINYDGVVSEHDLGTLCGAWLTETPLGSMQIDGLVNFGELAELANRWLWTSVWHREVPGDIDDSKLVNLRDFAILAKDWNRQGVETPSDLNLDGKVDANDLSWLSHDWLGPGE